MKKTRKSVKKQPQVAAGFARHVHTTLHSPIRPYIGWWVVSISAVWCSLVISAAFAQVSDTQQMLQDYASNTPMQTLLHRDGQQLPPFANGMPPTFRPCGMWEHEGSSTTPSAGSAALPCQPGGNGQQQSTQQTQLQKKNLTSFLGLLSKTNLQVQALLKKGAVVPPDLSQALADLSSAASQVKQGTASTTPDFLGSISADTQTIKNDLPNLENEAQLPSQLKQAQQQLTRLNKLLASDTKRAPQSKYDLTQTLADFQTGINQLQTVLDQATQTATSDPQTTVTVLHDSFFGQIDNVQSNDRIVQIALNLTGGISQMSRELKTDQTRINQLSSTSTATSTLSQLLSVAQGDVTQLKTLAQASPQDPAAIMGGITQLVTDWQALNDQFQQVTGNNGFIPQLSASQQLQFNLPPGYSGSQH